MPGAPPSCLACRERLPVRRGLCFRCYHRLGCAVRGGAATWAALEASGAALPARPRGQKMRKWLGAPPRDGG